MVKLLQDLVTLLDKSDKAVNLAPQVECAREREIYRMCDKQVIKTITKK